MVAPAHKLRGLNPRRNLPLQFRGREFEAAFLRSFQNAYLVSLKKRGVVCRDFALEGYGIADLIWLSWQHQDGATALKLRQTPSRIHRKRLTAFELKLSDWRKGLMQAYRYGYFANRTILVVPPELVIAIQKNFESFQDMNVGLWSFDPKMGKIVKHFTPKFHKPRNEQAHNKAIEHLRSLL